MAERALLGAMLLDPDRTFHSCSSAGVTGDYFSLPKNAEVYAAIDKLRKAGKIVDLLVLCESMKTDGSIDRVGGDEYIESLIDACPSSSMAESYIDILAKKHQSRCLMNASVIARERLLNGAEPAEIMAMLTSAVASLHGKSKVTETVSVIADGAEKEWQDARGRGFVGIPSVWPEVNSIIGGYRTGEVSIYGGYRGEGKSMVMSNEALHKARMGIPTLVLSLEMTRRGVVKRILGDIGNFSTFKMDIGKGTDHDFAALTEAKKVLNKLPLYIDDSVRTESEIGSAIAHYATSKEVKFVILDHMQLIRPSHRTGSDVADAKHISNEMSRLAKRYDVAFIILSQYSRGAEMNDAVPKLSSLKGSGAIEEDARCVVLIYRDPNCKDAQPPRAIWEIAKNNNGGTGEVKMVRVGNRQRWRQASTYIAGKNGDPPVYQEGGGGRAEAATGGERSPTGLHVQTARPPAPSGYRAERTIRGM